MISGYNTGYAPVTNLVEVISRGIKVFGFMVMWLDHKYEEEFYQVMPPKIASGQYKYREDLTEGFEYGGHAMMQVQKGLNTGKSVIVVARE